MRFTELMLNKSVETNRRPAPAVDTGRQFDSTYTMFGAVSELLQAHDLAALVEKPQLWVGDKAALRPLTHGRCVVGAHGFYQAKDVIAPSGCERKM